MSERFSVYHVPNPLTPLYALGSAILGRCVHSGDPLGPPWPKYFAPHIPDHPARASVYGFHATMVAPFRSKVPAETLAGTLDSVTLGTDAFDLGPLEVSLLEPGFPALVPKRVPRALTDLEERLVKTFSALSLPIEPDDLARREPLTVRQRALAKKWGYPYVLDQFRYHLTLGDPLTEKEEGMGRDRLNYLDLLRSLLTGEVTSGLRLDSLCLCRQASRGAPFRVISVSGFRPGQEPRPQGDEARPCDDIAPDRLERPYAPEFSEADLPGLK